MAKGMTFRAVAKLDDKQLKAGIKSAQGYIGKFASYVKGAFAFTGLANLSRQLISATKDFESAMARVQAVSNASGKGFEMMYNEARRLGETTRYTATEAANALENLTRNGVQAADATKMLASVLQMAQANSISLADAANIITNSLNMFGMAADEAAKVNDVYSNTASHAATNVQELFNAMTNLAPAAHTLGFTIEETSAAIGALAQKGVKGFDAGTQLRMALTKLADPKIIKKMNEMGVAIDENTMRSERYLGTVKRLQDAHLSLSDLVGIFSQKGAIGMQQLIASYDDFERLTKSNEKSMGVATRMYNQAIGSVQKELDILKSKWESLLISIGEQNSGAIKGLIIILQQIIENFKTVGGTIQNLSIVILPSMAKALYNASARAVSFSAAVSGIKAAMGGWVTILTTVITLVGNYLINAYKEATKHIRETEQIMNDMAASASEAATRFDALKASLENNGFDGISASVEQFIDLMPEFRDAIQAAADAARLSADGGLAYFESRLQEIYELQQEISQMSFLQKAYEEQKQAFASALYRQRNYWNTTSTEQLPAKNLSDWVKELEAQIKVAYPKANKELILSFYNDMADMLMRNANKSLEEREAIFKGFLQGRMIDTSKLEEMQGGTGFRNFLKNIKNVVHTSGWSSKNESYELFDRGVEILGQINALQSTIRNQKYVIAKNTFDNQKASYDRALSDKTMTKDTYATKMYYAADKLKQAALLTGNDSYIKVAEAFEKQFPNPFVHLSSRDDALTGGSHKKTDLEKVQEILSKWLSESKGNDAALKDRAYGTNSGLEWEDTANKLNKDAIGALYSFGNIKELLDKLPDSFKEIYQLLLLDRDILIESAKLDAEISKNFDSDASKKFKKFKIPERGVRDTTTDYKKKPYQIDKEEYELTKKWVEELQRAYEKLEEDTESVNFILYADKIIEALEEAKKQMVDLQTKAQISGYQFELKKLSETLARDGIKGLDQFAQGLDRVISGWKNLQETLSDTDTSSWEQFMAIFNYLVQIADSVFTVIDTFRSLSEVINEFIAKKAALADIQDAAATAANVTATSGAVAAENAEAEALVVKTVAAKGAAEAEKDLAAATVAAQTAANPAIGAASAAATIAAATSTSVGLAAIMAAKNGGIVGGSSYGGDKLFARVNSGELILNRAQQGNLWSIINGKKGLGVGTVDFRISGSNLVGTLNNYQRKIRG